MAVVTVLRGGHMVQSRIFTRCVDTIVATLAIRRYALVIIDTTGKRIDVMAHAAILSGGNVCR